MKEAQKAGVKRLAGKTGSCIVSCFFLSVFCSWRRAAPAVGGIPEEGVPDVGEMHADLMGTSGFQAALDQRGKRLLAASEAFHHTVAGARGLALATEHRHALAVERIAPEIA